MDFLPIFLDVKDRPCLVVGGGEVAARKVSLLLKAGAKVTVVAPDLVAGMKALHDQITYVPRAFVEEDLDGCDLVIAATDDIDLNARVAELARARPIPVNVVDKPERCSFIMPSIIDRSPVVAAVSTGGASPVLARLIRSRLESLIPPAYGRLATLVEGLRQKVKQRLTNPGDRRLFWEKVLDGPIAEMVFAGRDEAARNALTVALDDEPSRSNRVGEVYLVGAGPGDPDLLTLRALRLMQQADVVIYDRLVSGAVLELTRRDAEQIYAGKERNVHSMQQGDINQQLVLLAKEGKRVMRLKGGDPFIFGRGGEEIATLAEEGIPFQVVPGITAASGCAAYAGIPLTHRDYAHACVFVTGHLKDGTVNLDWQLLARPQQTVVIYMGLIGLPIICRELIRHGLPSCTPAALVQQGTTRKQRIFKGTLESLPEIVKRGKAKAPTVAIIGEVVKLHERLEWFESD